MMRLWSEGENRCCAPESVDDARQVAAQLGIPFYLVNYETTFREKVVDHFVGEYSAGRTPNPCLACNRHVRFGRLLAHAQVLGARFLATGHYARIERQDDSYQLLRGADPDKDQSYVLYMLGQAELERTLFPVGHLTKPEVRALATEQGLPVDKRKDSMDLCFVQDNDYRRFLRQQAPEAIRPGPIIGSDGQVLGQHRGLPFYTIGQRKGLGVQAAEAVYVKSIDAGNNALIVGTARELGRASLDAGAVRYVSGQAPPGSVRVQAKIRYRATFAAARWVPIEEDRARVEFDAPLRDIAPGQAVVAYLGDQVLGGGIIR
jgi:tRNA-specific 2-thiouridylase